MTNEQIDWSKAPEGATHAAISAVSENTPHVWYLLGEENPKYLYEKARYLGGGWRNLQSAPGHFPLIARPAECTAAPQWSGEELPPVGVVCEVDYCEEWQRCEVIAHFQQRCGMVAAFTIEGSDGAKSLDAFGDECFRPIRTPEQLAAEEREAAIDSALEVMKRAHWGLSNTDISSFEKCRVYAAAMIDDGYRKPKGGDV